MKRSNVILGASIALLLGTGIYIFAIRPNMHATERQFRKFQSAAKTAGWDVFESVSDRSLEIALDQWKKNLTIRDAEKLIKSAENKKESVIVMRFFNKWNPWKK